MNKDDIQYKTQLIHRTSNRSAYTTYNEGKLNGTTREDQNGMQYYRRK